MASSCRVACFLILALTSICFCEAIYSPYGKGVRLEDVQAITLHRGEKTTSRRARAVPQLNCVGGPCEFAPETVQCVNVGSDGMDVQWRCEADLPQNVKFARTQVTCEGFEYPDDERVLEGSCGLEYSLKAIGGGGGWFSQSRAGDYYGAGKSRVSEPPRNSWGAGQWIILILIMYIGYHLGRVYRQGTHRPQARPSTSTDHRPSAPSAPPGGFFSGGFSGASDNDGSGYGGSFGSGKASTSTGGGGSAWNGWTSAAAGYGLGYLMGNRRRAHQPTSFWGGQPRQQQSTTSWFSRGSNTRGGMSGAAGTPGNNQQRGATETRKATGYASTSRR